MKRIFFVLEVLCTSFSMPSNSRVVDGINNEKIFFKVDSLCISKMKISTWRQMLNIFSSTCGNTLLRLWSTQMLLHLDLVFFGWPLIWQPHAVLPLWMVVHAPLILYVPIKLYQQFFPVPAFSLLDSFIEGLLCRLVCLVYEEKSWSSFCSEEFSP